MQKRQGNGVQGKQAVRPHKSSWLETKPGPSWGGHVAPRWPKHRVQQHSKQTQHCAASGQCTSPAYSTVIITVWWSSSLSPGFNLKSISLPGVGHSCHCHKPQSQVYQLQPLLLYNFKQSNSSDCYCTNRSALKGSKQTRLETKKSIRFNFLYEARWAVCICALW